MGCVTSFLILAHVLSPFMRVLCIFIGFKGMFREFNLEDSSIIVALLNDADVSKWTSHIPFPYTENDAISWLKKQENSLRKPLAIEIENKLVGCISYWHLDSLTTEVGYWIGKSFWGKGIATTAVSSLLDSTIFPTTPKVAAKVAAENIGSQRVLEKCGFKVNKKCRVEKSGKMIDAFFYIKTNA
ncbi:GNAT family N-acetyltransferase [Alteromonas macleodii]|uniref:GNAT family N-acetyltransferase n=2 Tax=Alteromonas macleodii TaxID=28108 RepID=UPI0031407F22